MLSRYSTWNHGREQEKNQKQRELQEQNNQLQSENNHLKSQLTKMEELLGEQIAQTLQPPKSN